MLEGALIEASVNQLAWSCVCSGVNYYYTVLFLLVLYFWGIFLYMYKNMY